MSPSQSNTYKQKIDQPNYTQIPNVVFDYWMPKLSLAAQSILFAICRKTFGWQKTTDTISKNQLVKCTGVSKNTIQKAIEELESHELLIKHTHQNEYGCQPNTYSLNVTKPIEDEVDDGVGQNLGGGGSNSDRGVGQILTPQKKDLQKKEKEIREIGRFVRIKNSDYEKLSTEHGQEFVDEIFDEINDHCANNRPKGYTDYAAAFRTFLRNKKPDSKTQGTKSFGGGSIYEKCKELHGKENQNAEILVSRESVTFILKGCQSQPRTINFKDSGAKEQINNELRKREFKSKIE